MKLLNTTQRSKSVLSATLVICKRFILASVTATVVILFGSLIIYSLNLASVIIINRNLPDILLILLLSIDATITIFLWIFVFLFSKNMKN